MHRQMTSFTLPVVILAGMVLLSGCCLGRGTTRRVCVVKRGCPRVAPLPRCASSGPAQPLAELLAGAERRVGEVVRVEGPLRRGPGVCTLLLCRKNACCNGCGADLMLGAAAGGADPRATGLTLVDRMGGPAARRLVCSGDDSGLCCPVPTEGRTVVAEGRLRLHGRGHYALEDPTLCVR